MKYIEYSEDMWTLFTALTYIYPPLIAGMFINILVGTYDDNPQSLMFIFILASIVIFASSLIFIPIFRFIFKKSRKQIIENLNSSKSIKE